MMARFTLWRCITAALLLGSAQVDGGDQVVKDRNGDPWIVSIRPGARLAGLPLPGATRSVPVPSEPALPVEPAAPSPTSVVLPEPPLPILPSSRPTARSISGARLSPTVAVQEPTLAEPVPTPAEPPPAPLPRKEAPAPGKSEPAPAKSLVPPVPVLPSPVLPAARESQDPVVAPGYSSQSTPRINGKTYREAYAAVPYSYTEYLANPAYRHEAAMEILFGQMRPMTINKEYTPQLVPEPVAASPYRPFLFAHPEQWIYRYTDYRYQWYLAPQLTAPYGMF